MDSALTSPWRSRPKRNHASCRDPVVKHVPHARSVFSCIHRRPTVPQGCQPRWPAAGLPRHRRRECTGGQAGAESVYTAAAGDCSRRPARAASMLITPLPPLSFSPHRSSSRSATQRHGQRAWRDPTSHPVPHRSNHACDVVRCGEAPVVHLKRARPPK